MACLVESHDLPKFFNIQHLKKVIEKRKKSWMFSDKHNLFIEIWSTHICLLRHIIVAVLLKLWVINSKILEKLPSKNS